MRLGFASRRSRRREVDEFLLLWNSGTAPAGFVGIASTTPFTGKAAGALQIRMRGLYGIKLAKRSDSSPPLDKASLPPLGESQVAQVREEQLTLKSLWEQRPPWLRPVNSTQRGDRTLLETITNVATSLPFIVIGLQTPRKKPYTRLYADSLIGVGFASALFHVSRGEARKYFRWGDYTMIAASTMCLSRALQTDNSKALFLASAVLLPFQPFVVAAFHTGLMEATFARRVAEQPSLRKAHTIHTISTLVGGTLFIAEDMYPNTSFLHAGWHVAAAVGVTTCNKLLN